MIIRCVRTNYTSCIPSPSVANVHNMLESCDNRARGEKRNGAMFRRHAERSTMADAVIDAGQQVSPLGRCAAPRLGFCSTSDKADYVA